MAGRFCHDPPVGWLFVYGTLMPGRLRWQHVAGDVVEQRRATIGGTLYDTGLGYPALVLGAGPATASGVVHGWLLGFPADKAAAVLERLDQVEGPSYRRARVTTADGTTAVAYEFMGSPAGFTAIADGAWTRTDER
jgi:gamma-glutamylcyclotransferase (GGCT)/AIG2-like uncharacterized protein YtfP